MTQLESQHAADAQVVCSSRAPLRQMFIPLSIVCLGFAMMGFIGGTMEVLNKHFQDVLGLNKVESACIQASFFGAYIIGPLTASGWLVRKYGFKVSLVVSYSLLSTGCICFWPSGHYASFGAFCGSIFLVGSGFALLDCASIPYMSSLGPSKSSEIRVNIAFAIQSTFSVLALTIASYIILAPVQTNPHVSVAAALLPVQHIYLGAGCTGITLALICALAPIPEIHDSTLSAQLQLTQSPSESVDIPLHKQPTIYLAFFSSFTFVGSQGAIAAFFINFAQAAKPTLAPPAAARQLAIAQSIFAASRFGSTALMRVIKPRHMLLAAMLLTLSFLAAAMCTAGTPALVLLTCEFAAKSCVHPTIVSLALRGLGRHTKRGGAVLVSALASGMVFSPAMGAVAETLGMRRAVCVPLGGVAAALVFAVYVNVWRGDFVDRLGASNLAVLPPSRGAEAEGEVASASEDESGCCDGGEECEKACERVDEDQIFIGIQRV